ncbi:unnamed protein product [Tuber aestivum]|uniref:40S ribosomal protein S16 n=1 Tax=Tuber aestivum TaxID=59557 RepID=A0A292PLW9_9PEZI|nr:unnamed protein product [Tuber aestivum]
MATPTQSVQCFGKKKTGNDSCGITSKLGVKIIFEKITTAVAHCKKGRGLVKVNGSPLNLVKPEILRFKVYEPLLIVGLDRFAEVDIRVRVSGGGHTSQVYAIRQAIAKSIVAYYQKFVDEHSKNQLKQALITYDRSLLVADNRRCEPKKFGGPGARARYQSTYFPNLVLKTWWQRLMGVRRILPLTGVLAQVYGPFGFLVSISSQIKANPVLDKGLKSSPKFSRVLK